MGERLPKYPPCPKGIICCLGSHEAHARGECDAAPASPPPTGEPRECSCRHNSAGRFDQRGCPFHDPATGSMRDRKLPDRLWGQDEVNAWSEGWDDGHAAAEKRLRSSLREAERARDAVARERDHLTRDLLRERARLEVVEGALRGLVAAVARAAFTHRWADEAGLWTSRLSPDEALLCQAHDLAERALSGSSEGEGGGTR